MAQVVHVVLAVRVVVLGQLGLLNLLVLAALAAHTAVAGAVVYLAHQIQVDRVALAQVALFVLSGVAVALVEPRHSHRLT